MSNCKGVYQPRYAQKSAPYRIFSRYFEDFKSVYHEKYAWHYGFYREIIDREIEKYLKCGVLKYGFARVRCSDCAHEFLLAFSCKSKVCPSCNAKRMHEFERFVTEEILALVPHRHLVFCIPKSLRQAFLRNRESLNDLSRIAWNCILTFTNQTLDRIKGRPGGILVIQTHGNLVNPHPHVHAIVTDGLFAETGTFHWMPRYGQAGKACLQKLFEKKVIKFCLKKKYLQVENANRILSQRYSGFSVYVDSEIRTTASTDESDKMRQMLRYVSKSFISAERTVYEENAKTVLYKGSSFHPGLKRNFQTYKPIDFIAAVTAHIPNRHQKYFNYYGFYSSRTRGKRKAVQNEEQRNRETVIQEPTEAQMTYRRKWAVLIKKVYEIDPLLCPRCGGEMKVIAVIEDKEVIRKILTHVGEWTEEQVRGPPEVVMAEQEQITREPYFDGWAVNETEAEYAA